MYLLRRRIAMKTCNGCADFMSMQSLPGEKFMVCYEHEDCKSFGWIKDDEVVPTPDWCPKEAKDENL
jgi:hypothetical protein